MRKLDKIVDFFFEVGSMRRMRRMHSQALRESTESLADHSFRAAVIGLVLAEMEGCNSTKVVKMALLHDLAESRTGDANFVHKRYIIQHEKQAYTDQLTGMPGGDELISLLDELNELKTKEARVAKDADDLEQILLQRDYLWHKEKDFILWHEHMAKRLRTKSAKRIAKIAESRNPLQWVYNFAKIPPTKSFSY